MLIQVGDLPRVQSVRSEFWSHGLFCKVRRQRAFDNWGYIRLWRGHSWQSREISLGLVAKHRAQQLLRSASDEQIIDLAISDTWVVFRYPSADLPIPRGYGMRPDRYWYRRADNQLTDGHRRIVANLESMCCYLCSVMQFSTP
jgi:hypothetical protein